MERARIRLLGPFEADVEGHLVDLGGPRQRAVLALLVVAGGDVVPVDRIVDDLWSGEPPPRATGALQAYVSNLRRALEPDRAPRTPARVLVSAAPGYAIRIGADDVDAWEFERLVAAADTAAADRAEELLRTALALWRGPALAEYAAEPWAQAPAARWDDLRLVARERLAGALVRMRRFADAVVEAQSLVTDAPLREEGWRLLALAQYADGRQSDALGTLRSLRTLLADELGIDPSPALLQLERDVLAQDVPLPDPGTAAGPAPSVPRPEPQDDAVHAASFVGRQQELTALTGAGRHAPAGTPAVALVAGEAGAGKSALLTRARELWSDEGWRVAVGRCPESDGGPPAWAWAEALRALAPERAPDAHPGPLGALLSDRADESAPSGAARDAVVDRFRLHRAVGEWLDGFADRPLALLIDDAHRADAETRALLASVLRHPFAGRVLVVLAFRPESGAGPDELRATVAPFSPTRIRLTGLAPDAAAELIATVPGADATAEVVATLAERTDGNPFYLLESARLLASEGEVVATSRVPDGVADVLRRRFARLPAQAVAVLRLAALVGREVEVDVLVGAAELDEDGVLDALEAGLISDLLTEPAPGRVRFSHQLVRDTLVADVPLLRRRRWHARLADAFAALRPTELGALALHSVAAATAETAQVAADRAIAAGEQAEARYAYDVAIGHYEDALKVLDLLPGAAPDARIRPMRLLIGALLRAGNTIAATRALSGAVALAESSGDPRLLVEVLTAWQVPTPWVTRGYGIVDHDLIATIERVLTTVELTPRERCLCLFTLVRETAHVEVERCERASAEMVALAREIGDPYLVALALSCSNVVFLADLRPAEQAAMTAELGAIAREHRLVVFEQLAEIYGTQTCAVRLDLDRFAAHVRRAREIAHQYQLGQSIVVVDSLAAIHAYLRGDLDAAEAAWQAAGERQSRVGGVDARNQTLLARFLLAYVRGTLAELVDDLQGARRAGVGVALGMLALALLAAGRTDEAREAADGFGQLRPDYLYVLFSTIRGLLHAGLLRAGAGDPEAAQQQYDALLPFAGLVAGAGSTGYVFVPVSLALGRLAAGLNRPEAASMHLDQARTIAHTCGNSVWIELIDADRPV